MANKADVLEELFQKHFEHLFKNSGLLLVSHAGALIACLAGLKDYQNIPQLKGIGTFIAMESTGLILAIIGYVCVSVGYLHLSAVPHVKFDSGLPVPKIFKMGFALQLVSLLILLLTIGTVGIKLARL